MRRAPTAKFGALALATLAVGLAACGGDDGDDDTAQEPAKATPQPAAVDLDRFLMRKDEEPGFRPEAAPGAKPAAAETISGVDALVQDMGLGPADAQRLRDAGFISFTVQPIRGPRSAGVTNVALYATADGAKRDMVHETSPGVVRKSGPLENLRYFSVRGVPGARGFTATLRGRPASDAVGNVYWVQGRCMLVLGNQGPGPFVGPLSKGVRAIYERTGGECP